MKRAISRFRRFLPSREWVATNRWARPFAQHLSTPDIWHLNRRSVPRAVALGLLIAPIIPIAHTVVAALAAVPVRANLVVAAAVTWLMNPFTFIPFYYTAHIVGEALLHPAAMAQMSVLGQPGSQKAAHGLAWLLEQSGSLVLGTLVMAVVIASVGYLVASFGWRWNTGRKWRARSVRRAQSG